jgi:hypothetical protein
VPCEVAATLFVAIGFGAGDGNLTAGAFAGVAFFATGAALLPLAGAAFCGGAALRTGVLTAAAFLATTFLVGAGFFFAATVLAFAGAARRGAGLAAGRAALVAGFFEVLWAAGFFTDSPRNGTTRLAPQKAHRDGGPDLGRRGL